MSRVLADTLFVRLLAAAVFAVPLAGCGDDEPETAASPAPAPPVSAAPTSAPVPTTAPAPATSPEADPAAPSDASPAESATPAAPPSAGAAPSAAKAAADTPETAKKASPKKASDEEIAAGMKRVYDALKKEGLDPGKPIVSGESSGALQIKETTIVFYASPRLAATASARFSEALAESPQHVKVARKANRLFLMSLPTAPTDEQLATFRKIRQIANGAV